jgi:hypothetical protein
MKRHLIPGVQNDEKRRGCKKAITGKPGILWFEK